jgi:hypothetical protein
MKKFAFLCLLLAGILSPPLTAQTAQRTVLAYAGGTETLPNNYTVCWTLGEAFVATKQSIDTKIIVTEGFQQPECGTVPTVELPDAKGTVSISPNPTGSTLNITLSAMPTASIRAFLSDAGGRTLREVQLMELNTPLDLSNLPTAWYALTLTDGKNWVRTVKIIKE